MAPSRPTNDDDDFIFTLSDSHEEEDATEVRHSASGVVDDSESGERRTSRQGEKVLKDRKRKREAAAAGDGWDEATRRRTDRKIDGLVKQRTRAIYGERGEGLIDEEEEDEEGGEAEEEDDDGALDPDFEFDMPGLGQVGLVEEFDGWGDGDKKGSGGGREGVDGKAKKQGVDLDEIIERRRARKLKSEEGGGNGDARVQTERNDVAGLQDEPSLGDDDGSEQDGKESLMFEDDELLATDGFGAGAVDDEDEKDGEEDSNEEDHQNGVNGVGSDSDDDSVAAPTAHPDDVNHSDDDDSDTTAEDPEEVSRRAAFFAPDPEENSTAKSGLDSTNLNSFQSFSLSRPILKGLSTLSFTTPTPIQQKTIPIALLGKDVVGSAVTGSGKTAAFLLPILERLLYRPRKIPTTRVAILLPTRELAVQCHTVALKLAAYTDITFAQLIGGFSLRDQEAMLKKRPDVVIATPGRFIDHMRNSPSFTIDTLEILILDEADRMLEDGFAAELNEILSSIPRSRQTMLFSATMTESVDKLIRAGLHRPVRIMIDKKSSTVRTLRQEFVRLRPGREAKRLAYLVHLCSHIHTSRVIVFFRQKKSAHRVRVVFSLLGLRASELHGAMTQEQRMAAMESFRSGTTQFLLATDLASRGLDIRGVETVLNFEVPASYEIYLHRVGRTARAGRGGVACTIAAENDRKVVRAAVRAARGSGGEVVSRVVAVEDADRCAEVLDGLEAEVEAVLAEEREERLLEGVGREVRRVGNLVEFRDEIKARERRTWFESEKEKRLGKERGRVGGGGGGSGKEGEQKRGMKKGSGGGGGKLSGKEKKKLDDRRERLEDGGRAGWRKGKGSEDTVRRQRSEKKKQQQQQQKKRKSGKGSALAKGTAKKTSKKAGK